MWSSATTSIDPVRGSLPVASIRSTDGPPTDLALAGVLATACFACGRPYLHGDGRFCSPKCRLAFERLCQQGVAVLFRGL
jgi:hypothetical protein